MSARYGLGRLAHSSDIPDLQNKVEDLYRSYNSNSSFSNVLKASELVEKNVDIHRKLINSYQDVAYEAPVKSLTGLSYWPYTSYPYYYSSYYPYNYSSYYYPTTAAITAAASAASTSAVASTLARKNAEISDLSWQHSKEQGQLRSELSSARLNNADLKSELTSTQTKLDLERRRAETISLECKNNINDLKFQLNQAESKLACLEPKAEQVAGLETEIAFLKSEIKHVNATNALLNEQNARQSEIIRSRPSSPVIIHTSRPVSPVTITCSRPCSPCNVVVSYSRSVSPCSLTRSTSSLSPNNSTQLIRQNSLITQFHDLRTRSRLCAMDTLRSYQNCYETNQRIVFNAVQEAFSVAKRAFLNWKSQARSNILISHRGPETLEEAVQSYINRNVDLYDLPYMTSHVISALNCNSKISLPCGVSYSIISTFIREACRIAWEMSALAYPIDTAFAVEGEVFNDLKYFRSHDSDFCAPLVNNFVWPCLQQSGSVISKGEAATRREYSVIARTFTHFDYPIRRSRSCHLRIKY